MKNKLLCLALLGVFSLPSFAGDESGHGGDAYVSDFIQTAKAALENLKALPTNELEGVNVDTFTGAILNTEVHSEDFLILGGNEVDAINYPDKKWIRMSRRRWNELSEPRSVSARYNLVIHEYLGIMKMDDGQYQISQKLVKAMNLPRIDVATQWPTTPYQSKTPTFTGEVEAGMGRYTGMLNNSNHIGFYKGVRVSYFFNSELSMDLSVGMNSSSGWGYDRMDMNKFGDKETKLIPLILGGRYHFKIDHPFWCRVQPYLTLGAGVYFLTQTMNEDYIGNRLVVEETSTTQPGILGGVGTTVDLMRTLRVGIGLKLHKIFLKDSVAWLDRDDKGFHDGGFLSGTLSLLYVL